MIKTQVQIPDDLYRKAKAVAKAKEWSLAEVFRRGVEYITSVNPVDGVDEEWQLPVLSAGEFATDFDELDFKEIAAQDEVREV